MRIDNGHLSLPHLRTDFEHSLQRPDKLGVQRPSDRKGSGKKTSIMSHMSQMVTDLIGRLRDEPAVRPEEVQRVSEQLRRGTYDTREAAQDVAAAILASPDRFV